MNDITEWLIYKSEKISWEDIWKYKDNSDDKDEECVEKVNG